MNVETCDPVCGMTVNPDKARFTHEYEGTTYLFCCGGCQAAFRTDPEAFLRAREEAAGNGMAAREFTHAGGAAGSSATAYVCPMCPEVRETEPVPCPSCGMALEPEFTAPPPVAV